MEVDHDRQLVHMETLGLTLHEPEALLAAMRPSEEHVASRLTSPIVSTHLDTRNVAFERSVGAWPCDRQGSGSGLWEAEPLAEAARMGQGAVTAGPVTPGPPAGLRPVTPSNPCMPVCTGSCLPGRRLGQGVPSFLTSDLTCFPIRQGLGLWPVCTRAGFSGVQVCLRQSPLWVGQDPIPATTRTPVPKQT